MTKLLVLGLLDDHPMSGYDIQQKIRMADAERWGGVLVVSISVSYTHLTLPTTPYV